MPRRTAFGACVLLGLAVVVLAPENEADARPFGRRWCGCRQVIKPPAWRGWREAAALRPWFEKGAAFYTLDHTTTDQVMHVMGQEIKQKQDQTFAIWWSARGLDCDGNLMLDARILAIKTRIDIGRNVIEYDSEKRPNPNPIGAFYDCLMQRELRFIVLCEGTGITIEDASLLQKQLEAANPQYKSLTKSSVMQLETLANPFLDFTPPGSVFPGASWKRSRTRDSGAVGSYRDELTFTYLGRFGSLERIEATGTLNYQAPSKAGDLPFVVRSADLKGLQSQVLMFNACRRRLAERTMSTQLAGKMSVEVGGMKTEVNLKQTQQRRVSLSDTDPTWQPPAR